MKPVYLLSACRTAIGRSGGALSGFTAAELGAAAIKEAATRADLEPDSSQEVLMGNVLQAGQGQNPARQAALKAGIEKSVPCSTVNMVCGSGLKAVQMAAQAISAGDAECVIAGGMESMSKAPYILARERSTIGDLTLRDALLVDGLTDAFDGRHMALMCENLGKQYGISRDEQDAFAAESQRRCAVAQADGRFEQEIVGVKVVERKEERLVDVDEHPRPETTAESLAKLRPAFDRDGTITAGNASGLNDGAAAVVLASESFVDGRAPMARIVSAATAAMEPELFAIAPAPAVRLALERARLSLDQMDLIEANEAFAVQSLALGRELGWDPERVNVNGGAIALGHPIGASGTRILVTLLYELRRRGGRYGLATLCCGGGLGIAMVVENLAK